MAQFTGERTGLAGLGPELGSLCGFLYGALLLHALLGLELLGPALPPAAMAGEVERRSNLRVELTQLRLPELRRRAL
jgi:hypothetical protein